MTNMAISWSVVIADILETIVGTFETEEGLAEPAVARRADGSYLISGTMPADEFSELLGIELPGRLRRPSPGWCWSILDESRRPASCSSSRAGRSRWSTSMADGSTRS